MEQKMGRPCLEGKVNSNIPFNQFFGRWSLEYWAIKGLCRRTLFSNHQRNSNVHIKNHPLPWTHHMSPNPPPWPLSNRCKVTLEAFSLMWESERVSEWAADWANSDSRGKRTENCSKTDFLPHTDICQGSEENFVLQICPLLKTSDKNAPVTWSALGLLESLVNGVPVLGS